MIEIYGLTDTGKRLARNVRNPDTVDWRVIHYLDRVIKATKEQIAEYCGLSSNQASAVLKKLKRTRPPLVAEESGVRV